MKGLTVPPSLTDPDMLKPNQWRCADTYSKCDEGRPRCKRCLALKRDCPGYKNPWEVWHRQENTHAATLVQTRVTRKLRERQELVGLHSLPPRIHTSPITCALNRFYGDYSREVGIAFFSLLPTMSSATPAGCFHDALNATALASSSRQLNQPDLMVQAIRVYGKAITGLNEALQSPVTSRDDSVLVALFVLGLFEVSNGPQYYLLRGSPHCSDPIR